MNPLPDGGYAHVFFILLDALLSFFLFGFILPFFEWQMVPRLSNLRSLTKRITLLEDGALRDELLPLPVW